MQLRTGIRAVIGVGMCLAGACVALGEMAPPSAASPGAKPEVVRYAADADLWDAVLDRDGGLHVVYSVRSAGGAKRGSSDLFYVATTDAMSGEWGEPVVVPTGDLAATIGGERKALVAVMPDGAVLISWPSGGSIGAVRRAKAESRWSAVVPRDLKAAGHADTMTMSDGRTGRVAFAWTDTAVVGRGDDKLAAPVHVAISDDGGQTFASPVAINSDLLGACVCCTPDVAFDDSGTLWVAYRTSEGNIKEACVVRMETDGTIRGAIASQDEWHLVGCPMNGPELAVSGDGQTVSVTWTKEDVIRHALSSDGGKSFGAVRELGRGKYHSGAAKGDQLWVLWSHGTRAMIGHPVNLPTGVAVDAPATGVVVVGEDGAAMIVTDSPRHGGSTPDAAGGAERH